MTDAHNHTPGLRPYGRKVHLSTAIISVVLITTFCIQAVVSLFLYHHQRNNQYQTLQKQAELLCEQAARNLASALWNMDSLQAGQIVHNISLIPSVHSISVTDEHHRPIFTKTQGAPGETSATITAPRQTIDYGQTILGYVDLTMTTESIERGLGHYLLAIVAATLAITVLQAMVLSWLLGRLIVAPIKGIEQYVSSVNSSSPLLERIPKVMLSMELANLRSSIMAMVESLVTSERSYRSIYENALEGLFQTTLEGAFLKANPTLCEMFGYNSEDDLKRHVRDIGHHFYRDPDTRRHLISEVLEHGAVTRREITFVHRDGTPIHCLISIYAVLSTTGKIEYFSGSLIDISERKSAEERLEQINRNLEKLVAERTDALQRQNLKLAASEERYRNLVEKVQEGIITLDRHGILTFANSRMAAMLERPIEAFSGQSCINLVKESSREKFLSAVAAHETESPGRIEILFHRASGGFLHTLVSPAPIYDNEGRYSGCFVVVTDITALKQLQEQLLQAQKLESIGQLAAGIAHEINTPTQYVGSNLGFLEESFTDLCRCLHLYQRLRTDAGSGKDLQPAIAAIDRMRDDIQLDDLLKDIPSALHDTLEGINRIAKIVSSVKRFAHPGNEQTAPADLNEAISNTITISTNEWKYVAVMEVELDKTLPLVACNVSSINQAILNIVVNAAHAIGEARQAQPTSQGKIKVSTKNCGNFVEIKIADNGSGIPESIRERIFDPFFTTKEVGRGSGQGLAIARAIVCDEHHGRIWFESKTDEGTIFTVQLPFAQPSASEDPDARVLQRPPLHAGGR